MAIGTEPMAEDEGRWAPGKSVLHLHWRNRGPSSPHNERRDCLRLGQHKDVARRKAQRFRFHPPGRLDLRDGMDRPICSRDDIPAWFGVPRGVGDLSLQALRFW